MATKPETADAALKIIEFAKREGYMPEAIILAAKMVTEMDKSLEREVRSERSGTRN